MTLKKMVASKFLRHLLSVLAAYAVTSGLNLAAAGAPVAHGSGPASTTVVRHFIGAIQRRDFRSALEDTHSCRQAVEAIKKNNPAVLWKQLVDEYYGSRVASLAKSPQYWQGYGEALGASIGDSTSFVRAAIALLPPGSKWSISETRTEKVSDSLQWGPHTRVTVYVTLDYPASAPAPEVGNRVLRHAILEFAIHGSTHGIISVSRVSKADQLWPVPALTRDQADEMTQGFLVDKVRSFINPTSSGDQGGGGDRWLGVALPNYERPAVGEYRRLFESAGFKLRDWEIRPGWGANGGWVSPPASWRRYEHAVPGGGLRYYLEEGVETTVTGITQSDGTAMVSVHVRRKGCNEVCALLGRYWSSEVAQQIASETSTRYNGFFMTHWDGNPSANGSGNVMLPEEDDRTVSFEWRPRLGWAPVNAVLSSTAAQPRRLPGSPEGTTAAAATANAPSAASSWSGWITDETCGAKGANANHRECAAKCAALGAKLVLYSTADAKLYQLNNQASARKHAGEQVSVTGTADGDGIAVDSIQPLGRPHGR